MTGSIHLVSEAQSVGESSLFCRPLIEYFQQSPNLSLVVVDAEQNTPFIGRIYAPELYLNPQISQSINPEKSDHSPDLLAKIPSITLSASPESLHQNDVIFDLALQGKTVVVNLPSGSLFVVYNWLKSGNFLNLSAQLGVKIWQWFVTDGGAESLDILKKSYQLYGDLITHVIVKSQGGYRTIPKSWLSWNNDVELQSYLEKYQTYLLMMPTLSLPDYRWDIIHQNHLTLTQAKARYQQGITILEKQKIHTWLKTMFHGLSSIPLVNFNGVDDDELASLF